MRAFSDLKANFDQYLSRQKFNYKPKSLYDPFYYILNLGGKRVRPVALLGVNQLYNGLLEHVLPAAFAIELFHNFTLIHDDIMDEASIRRGQPTVHVAFGNNNAILSGDAMFVIAYDYLMQASQAMGGQNLFPLLRLFNKTAREVCEGQQLDMDFETEENVSTEEYIRMITLKTAVLLAASMQMGALLANAPEEEQEALYSFGKYLGVSFQITDDVLDTYGDENFGKKIGGDICQNKKTYLLITAKAQASREQRHELEQIMSDDNREEAQKIKEVKAIYDALGIKEEAEKAAEYYYQMSLEALDKIESIDTTPLKAFAQQLLYRTL